MAKLAALLLALAAGARAERSLGRWRWPAGRSPEPAPVLAPSVQASLVEQGQEGRAGFPSHHLASVAAIASPYALLGADGFAMGRPTTAATRDGTRLDFAPTVSASDARKTTALSLFGRLRKLRRRLESSEPGEHLRAELTPWFDKLEDVVLEHSGPLHREYSARVRGCHTPVSVKVIDTSDRALRKELEREILLTRRFGGGDVATVFNVDWQDDPEHPTAVIMMEKFDGDLRSSVIDVVKSNGLMVTRETRIRLLIEILRGLRKLADQGYVHRNVNPSNVAVMGNCRGVTASCHAKLAGMGLATKTELLGQDDEPKMASNQLYAPPEAWIDDRLMGTDDLSKMDVWSVGMMAFELFVGRPPALQKGRSMPFEIDLSKDEEFGELKRSDPLIAGIIEKMLSKRTWLRPTVDGALDLVTDVLRKRGVYDIDVQRTDSVPDISRVRAAKPRFGVRVPLPGRLLPRGVGAA